jgi:hypothetical protein
MPHLSIMRHHNLGAKPQRKSHPGHLPQPPPALRLEYPQWIPDLPFWTPADTAHHQGLLETIRYLRKLLKKTQTEKIHLHKRQQTHHAITTGANARIAFLQKALKKLNDDHVAELALKANATRYLTSITDTNVRLEASLANSISELNTTRASHIATTSEIHQRHDDDFNNHRRNTNFYISQRLEDINSLKKELATQRSEFLSTNSKLTSEIRTLHSANRDMAAFISAKITGSSSTSSVTTRSRASAVLSPPAVVAAFAAAAAHRDDASFDAPAAHQDDADFTLSTASPGDDSPAN